MRNRWSEILKQQVAKFRKIYQHKYFWSCAIGVIVVSVLTLILLLSGKQTHFNTAHQELSVLADNVRNYYKIRPDYWGLDTANAVKNHLIPEEMLHNGKVISAIGREIVLGQDAEGNMVMPGMRYFALSMHNLSKSACVAMISQPFSQEDHWGLLRIVLVTPDKTQIFEWGGNPNLPVSKKDAKQFCQNKNIVSWIFE